MNPYILSSIAGRYLGSLRECPVCRKKQKVSPDKKEKPVSCRFCGAAIPPKKTRL